jgi:hypothetical protein
MKLSGQSYNPNYSAAGKRLPFRWKLGYHQSRVAQERYGFDVAFLESPKRFIPCENFSINI